MENKNKRLNILIKTAECALLAAVIAVSAQIAVPLPSGVPVTLQTFAVTLCASIGGIVEGPAAVAVYILLGAFGVPVFSSFRGGIAVLIGPTGGFITGFIPLALMSGLRLKNKALNVIASIGGLLVCHLIGAVQYSLVTDTDFIKSLLLVCVPFLVKDVLSVILAMTLAVPVRKAIKKAVKSA
ncbi:MAG: biotin transporter BioY [Clostridia bacterium]|nr:biotin transporter BioY [Clostridia bacterium]